MNIVRLAVPALMLLACSSAPMEETNSVQQPFELAPHALRLKDSKPTGGTSGTTIIYYGGPLMLGTVHSYLIWYGNWSGNTATTIIPSFVSSLGGSPYFDINTTYYDASNNHVSGNVVISGQTNDSYSQGSSLTDSSVQMIVSHAITNGSLPLDSNGVYFVLTSADVSEGGFCSSFCGWHTHTSVSNTDIKYAFVGNPDRCPSACEAQTVSPNGNAGADGMASILAHEFEESISDEDLNAWHTRRGYENADICAWTWGTTFKVANGSLANMMLGGNYYLIQQNFANANGGYCTTHYP